MVYYVRLDQGDYLEVRGGHDWGRANKLFATKFKSRREARAWAKMVGGTVCRLIG
jgi:hypothetical protein